MHRESAPDREDLETAQRAIILPHGIAARLIPRLTYVDVFPQLTYAGVTQRPTLSYAMV